MRRNEMENKEFLLHLKTIKELIKTPNVRIILLHPPYTKDQQKTIDSICRVSKHIIGQIERTTPMKDAAEEIGRILHSNKEPFVSADKLKYVILGKIKPKN